MPVVELGLGVLAAELGVDIAVALTWRRVAFLRPVGPAAGPAKSWPDAFTGATSPASALSFMPPSIEGLFVGARWGEVPFLTVKGELARAPVLSGEFARMPALDGRASFLPAAGEVPFDGPRER